MGNPCRMQFFGLLVQWWWVSHRFSSFNLLIDPPLSIFCRGILFISNSIVLKKAQGRRNGIYPRWWGGSYTCIAGRRACSFDCCCLFPCWAFFPEKEGMDSLRYPQSTFPVHHQASIAFYLVAKGLFLATLQGHGTVWIQSRSTSEWYTTFR